jgi:hypothetical protein
MIVLLVTGTRNALSVADERLVIDRVDWVLDRARRGRYVLHVIVGDCPTGVDAFVRRCLYAPPDGMQATVGYADRAADGRLLDKAGPRRNQWMVDEGLRLDAVERRCLAFPAPDSRGTHDCARRARAAGYNVTFHPVGE